MRKLSDDLYEVSSGYSLKFGGGGGIPLRSVVIRLTEGENKGKLWIHSPLDFKEEDVKAIRDLGEVAYIVGSNAYHHLFIPKALEHFPNAKVFASKPIQAKQPGLRAELWLDEGIESSDLPFDSDIQSMYIAGTPKFMEWIFFHRRSNSLIVTDLLFNLQQVNGLMSTLVTKVLGTYKKFAMSRVWSFLVKDKTACSASLRPILALDVKRVLPAHGDVLELKPGSENLTEELRSAMVKFL